MSAPQPGTPLPWEVGTFQSEGEYGIGPDTTSGFAVSTICDAKGNVLFDALNSDAIEVHEDGPDEDGFVSAWDAVSAANATYIVHAANNFPKAQALADALREIAELQGEINPSNYDHDDACELNRQFCYSATIALSALEAWDAKP